MSTGPVSARGGPVGPPNATPSTTLQDQLVSFSDGDVIFVAQDVRFYVHKDILSQKSSSLAETITAASPVSYVYITQPLGRAKVEARVSDTAYDFNQLLRYVYGFSTPQTGDDDSDENDLNGTTPATPFSVLAAWLRLGCKYGINELADAARKQLQRLFPQTLRHWDDRVAIRARHSFEPRHAIEGFNLFRHVNEARAIPIALYMVCQLEPAILLTGTTRADGRPERLSVRDRVLVYEARRELARHGAKLVGACAMFERSEGCHSDEQSRCSAVMHELQHGAQEEKKALLAGDPLDRAFLDYICGLEVSSCWDARGREDDLHVECDGACTPCVRETADFWVELREIVWRDLPRIAGVEEKVYYY
ncbi:hypothetical protein C8Q80DRAFT_1272137 [Daedaleopsis nitida]|nr:hypothetical protein C8Q80DRAFT_1272137 [Daedaleopsis nitida]